MASCVLQARGSKTPAFTELDAIPEGAKQLVLADISQQISKDLHRTFPRHPHFLQDSGKADLEMVLSACAACNPVVGYCQGMNFIAGMLILGCGNQELAFQVLSLLTDEWFKPYFICSLQGVTVDSKVLLDLISIKIPELFAHMQKIGVSNDSILAVVSEWLIALWSTAMTSECVLRVWDVIIATRKGRKVMMRVGLALLIMFKQELVACNDPEEFMIEIMQLPRKLFDADKLLSVAFNEVGALPRDFLARLQAHATRTVMCGPAMHEVFVLNSMAMRTLCERAIHHAQDSCVSAYYIMRVGCRRRRRTHGVRCGECMCSVEWLHSTAAARQCNCMCIAWE